jgi:hypothetical protein
MLNQATEVLFTVFVYGAAAVVAVFFATIIYGLITGAKQAMDEIKEEMK